METERSYRRRMKREFEMRDSTDNLVKRMKFASDVAAIGAAAGAKGRKELEEKNSRMIRCKTFCALMFIGIGIITHWFYFINIVTTCVWIIFSVILGCILRYMTDFFKTFQ